MSRRSTTLTRLALALLAVTGFIAPIAEREADAQVQTVSVERAVEQHHQSAASPREPIVLSRSTPQTFAERLAPTNRRYLLHHAWLI